MISHEHRCIFIHIQRTAGTSIEYWLTGSDWWNIDASTKHLTAHQAKCLYADHWDDYFKFSIVRHPWDRVVSLGKYRNTGVLQDDNGKLELDGWVASLEFPEIEFDQRHHSRCDVLRPGVHQPGMLYSNILDEELDYIGKFENLPEVIDVIKGRVKDPPERKFPRHEVSKNRIRHVWPYYSAASYKQVEKAHFAELSRWGY